MHRHRRRHAATIYTKLISNNYMSVAEILNKHKYPFDVIAVCLRARALASANARELVACDRAREVYNTYFNVYTYYTRSHIHE